MRELREAAVEQQVRTANPGDECRSLGQQNGSGQRQRWGMVVGQPFIVVIVSVSRRQSASMLVRILVMMRMRLRGSGQLLVPREMRTPRRRRHDKRKGDQQEDKAGEHRD